MSNFEVLVCRVETVTDHPQADRLSLITLENMGYTCISAKLEDGSHRYSVGDLVCYIPSQAVLPEWMMKQMDFWDNNKDKPTFRYVKPKKLRGIFSEGILYPVVLENNHDNDDWWIYHPENKFGIFATRVEEGQNVADILGITKWEPEVPARMAGQMHGAYAAHTMKFDFDAIHKKMKMFEEGEFVEVQEKIHGTAFQAAMVSELCDPVLFGSKNNILVTSKGLGARGFILKNVPENKDNLYIQQLQLLLDDGLEEKLIRFLEQEQLKSIHIFGEVFGAGVQDLTYGQIKPTFRMFDIAINKQYVNFDTMHDLNEQYLNLPTVPVLYDGPFERDLIATFVDGKDTISGTNIREGVVIRGIGNHPRFGRKIAKWVSEFYSLRKSGTEYT